MEYQSTLPGGGASARLVLESQLLSPRIKSAFKAFTSWIPCPHLRGQMERTPRVGVHSGSFGRFLFALTKLVINWIITSIDAASLTGAATIEGGP